MPALFPTWSNHAVRVALVLAFLLVLAVPLALMGYVRSPWNTGEMRAPEQPVPFDHRHHVDDDLVDCLYCHSLADRSAYAGVPGADLCMNCHGQIWNQSPVLEPVRESYFRGIPIVWARVYALPDFVYFDHSAHVLNGVGCETCHGRLDQQARVTQVRALSMGWCIECHRDPAPHLRPPEAITAMGWSFTGDRDSLGAALMSRYEVNAGTDCTTCHR
jgi:hypothetical protein